MKGIKKFIVLGMVAALIIGNIWTVSAASIGQVSKSRPVWGQVSGVDTGSSLNVRQTPDITAAIISSLPAYSFIMIVGEAGDFYEVQYNTAGNYGYVSKDYILFVGSNYYLVTNIDGGNLNMRSGAGTSYGISAKIPMNTSFAYVKDYDDEWYQGIYGNVNGYTSKQYTKKVDF